MDSRAQFEAWWSENMFIGGKCLADEQTKRRCLRAWQSSRAAIEVELPAYRDATTYGFSAFNDALDICEMDLRKHGISIKGESS